MVDLRKNMKTQCRSIERNKDQNIKGSFSNDDGDGNENNKKTIGLISKTITQQVHHAFLYISLPSLHNYDVKFPKATFYEGHRHKTTNFFFSL